MPQYFKGDALELRFDAIFTEIMDQLSMQKDLFFEGAYEAMPLGDVLHEDNFSPLSNAIKLSIFRQCFNTVYEAFIVAGSFESYITVFQKIFGEDVEIEFIVPGPGELEMNIVAQTLVIDDLVARYIDENAYFFDELVDEEGDNIAVGTVKGFKSQYELEQMLFEMVPAGIATTITLSFEEP